MAPQLPAREVVPRALFRDSRVVFLHLLRPNAGAGPAVALHGASNAIIQATWSPHVTVLTHRKNIHSLGDKRLPPRLLFVEHWFTHR